jgi:hypothetical protein
MSGLYPGENMEKLLQDISVLILQELERSKIAHQDHFSSPHEASAVIREEIEELEDDTLAIGQIFRLELWNEIKKDGSTERMQQLLLRLKETASEAAAESIQVAAMAQKGLYSLIPDQEIL